MKLDRLSRMFHVSKEEFIPHSLQKPHRLNQLDQIDNDSIELARYQQIPIPPVGTVAFRKATRVKSVWLHASQKMIVLEEEEKAL